MKPEFVLRIETPQGISDEGAQRISYRSSIDEVESIEASTIKPDGTEIKVPESAIRTQDEDSDGGATEFSDTKYKVIVFPAVEVGSRVRYKVIINHRTTPFPRFFNEVYVYPAAVEMGTLGSEHQCADQSAALCRPARDRRRARVNERRRKPLSFFVSRTGSEGSGNRQCVDGGLRVRFCTCRRIPT